MEQKKKQAAARFYVNGVAYGQKNEADAKLAKMKAERVDEILYVDVKQKTETVYILHRNNYHVNARLYTPGESY